MIYIHVHVHAYYNYMCIPPSVIDVFCQQSSTHERKRPFISIPLPKYCRTKNILSENLFREKPN